MQSIAARFLIALLIILQCSPQTYAQKKLSDNEQAVADYTKRFSEIQKNTPKRNASEKKLIEIQNEIDTLLTEVSDYRKKLEPNIADLKSQIKRLGPVPEKDAAPEAETVKQERERLNKLIGISDGADKKAALLITQMNQFRRQVQEQRLAVFTKEIFRRYDSPLGIKLWGQVWQDAYSGFELLQNSLVPAKDDIAPSSQIIGFFIIIFVLWLILYFFSRDLARKFRRLPEGEDQPAFFRRASSAIAVSIIRLFPWVSACLLLYPGLSNLGLLNPQSDSLLQTTLFGIIIFFCVSAVAKTWLAPNRPVWRLYPLSNRAAKILYRQVQLMVFIFALNIVWSKMNEVVNAPLSLVIGQSFIASLIFALVLGAVAFTRFQNGVREESDSGETGQTSRMWPVWLKLPIWLLVITIIVSSVLGYIPFARFIASQVVISGALVVVAILFYIAIEELTSEIQDERSPIGNWFGTHLNLDDLRRKQVAYIISTILNLLLLSVIIPVILLEWGFSWGDIKSWLALAFFGVQIGPVSLSLSTLVIALVLLAAGVVLTRIAQKWLERGPLALSNLEDGVADSVRTGVGYVGFALSLLVAISYVGVDFTNLAIVAGALSVGIGFGLQSIVNNFVSGLILLIERPIKVGDWVVVGSQQGHVRKINVRYTEIETFDRSSVIIPNSDLISNTITNWTHGNSVGRVMIAVGVSYSSDARKVHDLLLDTGRSHPKCLSFPPASVVFEEFGASSLDFTLRVFIANIRDVLVVKTELRMAILEKFREHGIEIPFPQRDLHIKDSSLLRVVNHGTQ